MPFVERQRRRSDIFLAPCSGGGRAAAASLLFEACFRCWGVTAEASTSSWQMPLSRSAYDAAAVLFLLPLSAKTWRLAALRCAVLREV